MRALTRSALKSLAQGFQKPSESPGSCFHPFELLSSSETKLVECFIYKRSLLIAVAACSEFLKALQWRKNRSPLTACMQISLNRTLLRMCPC